MSSVISVTMYLKDTLVHEDPCKSVAKKYVVSLMPSFCQNQENGIVTYLKNYVDTHGQARGTFTAQASLDLNPAFPAT